MKEQPHRRGRLAGGTNPQGYVSDPSGWVDPLGLAVCSARYGRYKALRNKGHSASEAAKLSKVGAPKGPLNWSGVDRNGLSAKDHVRRHGTDMLGRPQEHGVFNDNPINQTASAWQQAKDLGISPTEQWNGTLKYEVPSPNAGWQGGNPSSPGHGQALNTITIFTNPGSNQIKTAYPTP